MTARPSRPEISRDFSHPPLPFTDHMTIMMAITKSLALCIPEAGETPVHILCHLVAFWPAASALKNSIAAVDVALIAHGMECAPEASLGVVDESDQGCALWICRPDMWASRVVMIAIPEMIVSEMVLLTTPCLGGKEAAETLVNFAHGAPESATMER